MRMRTTRHFALAISPLLALVATDDAAADCPCWSVDDLRGAVAVLPDDPVAEDDVGVSRCELSVDPLVSHLSARLIFQNRIGSRFEGGVVEFDSSLQRCVVIEEGLNLPLPPPTEIADLSEDEAAACARSIGQVCQELLPEPSASSLLAAGTLLLGLLARRRVWLYRCTPK